MAMEKSVDSVVRSYDLPKNIEERLIRIAQRRIEELQLFSFDEQYEYIAHLVEKFTTKPSASLDATIRGENGDLRLYDIIAAPEERPFEPISEMEEEKLIPVTIVPDLLKNKISEKSSAVLGQLLQTISPEQRLGIFPTTVVENAEEINARLEELAAQYEVEGRLVIPRRPITYITFDPLSIRFGRRSFEGNPLKYFRENYGGHKGLTRSQLEKEDASLYMTLLTHHQIEKAIPETVRRRFTHSELELLRRNVHEKVPIEKIIKALKRPRRDVVRRLKSLSKGNHDGRDSTVIENYLRQNRGKRRFLPDPLAYFRENESKYSQVRSRSDLSLFDQSLYCALRNSGQLDEAIPKVYGPWEKKKS